MTIQQVGAAYAALLAALQARCFPAEPWGEPLFRGLLADDGVFGLLAVSDDVPQGFALWRLAAGEAEILTLGVIPEARREGRGSALVAAGLAAVAAAGGEEVFLEVAEDNDSARRLYAAHGFKETGRRKAYYGPQDALIMRWVRPSGSEGG